MKTIVMLAPQTMADERRGRGTAAGAVNRPGPDFGPTWPEVKSSFGTIANHLTRCFLISIKLISVLNQVISSRSASMIFSFFILLMAYSIVMNTIKSTLNTLIAILPHGNTKSKLSILSTATNPS